jgi:DNA-binding transcriptional MerR regulator
LVCSNRSAETPVFGSTVRKTWSALEQIAALKFLGIPLQEIKLLLKHGPLTLVDSLHVQREALAEKRRLIDRAVVAIEAAEKVCSIRANNRRIHSSKDY